VYDQLVQGTVNRRYVRKAYDNLPHAVNCELPFELVRRNLIEISGLISPSVAIHSSNRAALHVVAGIIVKTLTAAGFRLRYERQLFVRFACFVYIEK